MDTTTHKLTSEEAHQIKVALLTAVAQGGAAATNLVDVTEGLIDAFRRIDEATAPEASSKA